MSAARGRVRLRLRLRLRLQRRRRLCRRPCLAGAGAAGSVLMPPPEELGCRRLPPFAVHGAAVPSPAVALRVPVPVPALCQCPVATLLLAAPMMLGALLSLCFLPVLAPAAGDAARECGLGAETGGRGATSPGTLGLGLGRVLLQSVRGSRAWGPAPCQCGLQLAAGSWQLEGGRCRALSLAAALVHGRGRGRGAAPTGLCLLCLLLTWTASASDFYAR